MELSDCNETTFTKIMMSITKKYLSDEKNMYLIRILLNLYKKSNYDRATALYMFVLFDRCSVCKFNLKVNRMINEAINEKNIEKLLDIIFNKKQNFDFVYNNPFLQEKYRDHFIAVMNNDYISYNKLYEKIYTKLLELKDIYEKCNDDQKCVLKLGGASDGNLCYGTVCTTIDHIFDMSNRYDYCTHFHTFDRKMHLRLELLPTLFNFSRNKYINPITKSLLSSETIKNITKKYQKEIELVKYSFKDE